MFAAVGGQVGRAGEGGGTLAALEGFLPGVDPGVLHQDAGSRERRPALALEGVVRVVSLHVYLVNTRT